MSRHIRGGAPAVAALLDSIGEERQSLQRWEGENRMDKVYDYSVKAQNGETVPLAKYRGKVLLIVNTATGCGFTPQYEDLQAIYEKLQKDGLEILDFPCNQFGGQAPGGDEEIHSFCTGRFGITFPQFSKIDVIGENADPLYQWLEKNSVFRGFDKNPSGAMLARMLKKQGGEAWQGNSVKWNFTKFLVGRDGTLIERFEPTTSLKKVEKRIREAL